MRISVALVVAAGMLLTGCEKIVDHFRPGKPSTPVECRIKSFSYEYYGSIYKTEIEYDLQGNPVTITYFDEFLSGGKTTESLTYDSLGRLVRHEPDIFMGYTRIYVYEGNYHTPVRDTALDFAGNVFLETFEHDNNGRIISLKIELIEEGENEEGFLFETEFYRYYYDFYGNRQANPFDHPWHSTIRYSKNPSLYSLHPVWQLIHRDYSRNSVPNLREIHPEGYPVSFVFSEFAYWQPFLDLNLISTIEYECN